MKLSVYFVPLLLLFAFCAAALKKVPVSRTFTEGASKAIPLAVRLFPYLAAVFAMTALMDASGLSSLLEKLLAPLLKALGIPAELAGLMIVKPFSGSGSLGVVADLCEKHGADSLIARCASVVYGSSETTFYVSAVYFGGSGKKNLAFPIATSLAIGILSAGVGCAFVRLLS